jgi:uncharacterized protein (TIGR00369 family)
MDNPDHRLVQRFLADGAAVDVATNNLAVALGCRLVAHDPAAKALTMTFSPGDQFRQGAGLIQGGAVAAMLDFAMAFAAMTELADGAGVSTTTMTASFLRPAAADAYRAVGRIERAGQRMIFTGAELFADERKIAVASSAMLVIARNAMS